MAGESIAVPRSFSFPFIWPSVARKRESVFPFTFSRCSSPSSTSNSCFKNASPSSIARGLGPGCNSLGLIPPRRRYSSLEFQSLQSQHVEYFKESPVRLSQGPVTFCKFRILHIRYWLFETQVIQ